MFTRVQKAAKKRREAELRVLGQRRMDEMERRSREQMRREVSRQRWQAKEARQEAGDPGQHPASLSRQADPPRPNRVSGEDVNNALSKLLAKAGKSAGS